MQMEGSASPYASMALLFLAMTSSQFRHNKHTLQLNIFKGFPRWMSMLLVQQLLALKTADPLERGGRRSCYCPLSVEGLAFFS